MANRWTHWIDVERGALNLIDHEAINRAVSCVKQGISLSLGLPIGARLSPSADIRPPIQHYMLRDGGDYAAGLPERPGYGYADDVIVLPCHGTTHLDALSHVWQDGTMWGGAPSSSVTSLGARRFGVETVGPITTRAVFVDLAGPNGDGPIDGEPIEPETIQRALEQSRTNPAAGDALLVRTGWLARWRSGNASMSRWPGLSARCAEWIVDAGFAVVGADNISVEVEPSGDPQCAMPLHVELIRNNGLFFLELLDLEKLALSGVGAAMLVVAPLNIVGGSGSPVAPVALI